MPNSGDNQSLVIGIKAVRLISIFIYYHKLFNFSSTRISIARLLGFCVIELQNTLEIFWYKIDILQKLLRNFLLTLSKKLLFSIQKGIAGFSCSHVEGTVNPRSNNRSIKATLHKTLEQWLNPNL